MNLKGIMSYFYLFNTIIIYKILYTTLLSILLLFAYTSYAFESDISHMNEIGVLTHETTIIQQWENILNTYNKENDTNFSYTNIDALPDILINLYEAWKIEDLKILWEWFALKNRVSIYEQFTPEQNFPTYTEEEWNLIHQNNYSPLTNYSRYIARQYAYNNVYTRNPYYNIYEGEYNGQNFVSQVLSAGWIPYVGQFIFDTFNADAWFYNSIIPSHTWGNAHAFYVHAMISDKYTKVNNNPNGRSQLQIWDIIQMDIGNNGTINHSMVVTKKTGNNYNQIYVTYNIDYDLNMWNWGKDVPLNQAISNVLNYGNGNVPYTLHLWKINY